MTRNISLFALGVAGALTMAQVSIAANGDVDFSGAVLTSCTVNVAQNGTLVGVNGSRRLTSAIVQGGDHGTVQVTTTGYGYQVSTEAPTDFDTKPTAESGPYTFTADMRAGGVTPFAWTSGTETLNLGTTNLRVRLNATKPAQTSFANGDYVATVILRCE